MWFRTCASFKVLSDQVIRYPCFCSWKLFICICSFSAEVTCAFLVSRKQCWNYSHQKNDVIYHIIDKIKIPRITLWIGHDPLRKGGHLNITTTVSLINTHPVLDNGNKPLVRLTVEIRLYNKANYFLSTKGTVNVELQRSYIDLN